MPDPLIDQVQDTVGDQVVGRRIPRALTPFRTPAYRWLTVALAASSFASGVWLVALVWEVIRLGGGPEQLSTVMTAGAVGVPGNSTQARHCRCAPARLDMTR